MPLEVTFLGIRPDYELYRIIVDQVKFWSFFGFFASSLHILRNGLCGRQ